MLFDFITQPLWIYGALAMSLCLFLYLFVSAKFEIRRLQKVYASGRSELNVAMTELSSSVVQMQRAQTTAEQDCVSVIPRPGLNLNKRRQALRMHSRGESAETIAAALDMPQSQVKLLMKIDGLGLDQA